MKTAKALKRRDGVERFLDVYRDARLLPYSPSDSELMRALERCLGCGTCLAVCPVVGSAASHPYPGPRAVATSLSRSVPEFWTAAGVEGYCTTCLACQEACPGDVPVWRAVLMIRAKNFEQATREGREPLGRLKRFLVDFFAENRLAQAGRWGAALQGLAFRPTASGSMKARLTLPLGPLGNRLVPPLARRPLTEEFSAPVAGADPDGPRVAVFAGCLDNFCYTDTGRSLVEVLRRHAREVVVPATQVCCGAPALYSGDLETTRRLAALNGEVFAATGCDFVVTACATCGDVLTRDYPVLGPDSAAGATWLARRTRDIHVFLASEVELRPPARGPAGRGDLPAPGRTVVTVHDPCHLSRGQGVAEEVRVLLGAVPGAELREMADPRACCGGAGSFCLEHYDIAAAIRRDKIADIAATGAGLVVTGCPSCRLHISDGLEQAGTGRPVRHLVDLLAESYRGGPAGAGGGGDSLG